MNKILALNRMINLQIKMGTTKGLLKTCQNGHTFYKRSDCPTCPNYEKLKKPTEGFLSRLSSPARNALLQYLGIDTLEKLSAYTEKEILKLYGIGKAGMPILFLAFICNPIVTRHDKVEEQFYADSADYSSVVQLRLRDLTGLVEMEGTFIQQDWIITAAHGLNSVEANQQVIILDSTYTITKIIVHPDFEGFENDIALVQLDRPISTSVPISLFSEKTELDQYITIVGRGWTGTGLTGPVKDDQKFRIATNKIDSVSTHWIKFRFDEPHNPNTTELEGVSGPGDSGGPAFIEISGLKYLAGVSSNQLNEQIGLKEGHYGVIEYYTRVSNYIPWIDEVIDGNFQEQKHAHKNVTNWGFPDTELGNKATLFMDAVSSNTITDSFMEQVFYLSFRESFDLKGFVQGISNSLVNPHIGEIQKAKNNILIFTVRSENKTYLIQLEADKRDNYLIGGLVFKKMDE